jgi:hypothetical protein
MLRRLMEGNINFKFRVENIPGLSAIRDDHLAKGQISGTV